LGGRQTLPIAPPRLAPAADEATGVTHVLESELTEHGLDVTLVVRLRQVDGASTHWSDRIHLRADELFSVENSVTWRRR